MVPVNSFSKPSPSLWDTLACQAFDRALQDLGLPAAVLMEEAANSLCGFLESRLNQGDGEIVAFLCGPGNNGADGVAAARLLLGRPQTRVIVYLPYGEGPADGLLAMQLKVFQNLGGEVKKIEPGGEIKGIPTPDIVVDALFGVGLTRAMEEEQLSSLAPWLESGAPILAVDCPSGLDCTTGQALGRAIKATWTLSFVAAKAGFSLADGPSHTGEVLVAGIGVRQEIADAWLARGQHFETGA
ncbi:MAG: NAD(P)H-hydrate epimerase [Planctomycetota bacterium]